MGGPARELAGRGAGRGGRGGRGESGVGVSRAPALPRPTAPRRALPAARGPSPAVTRPSVPKRVPDPAPPRGQAGAGTPRGRSRGPAPQAAPLRDGLQDR